MRLSDNQPIGGNDKYVAERFAVQIDELNRVICLDWNTRHGYMTGQEWFDRFWREFTMGGNWTSIMFTKSDVIRLAEEAAKKAAGLE